MYSKKKKSSDLNDPNILYDSDHEPSRGGGDFIWMESGGEKDSLWGDGGEDSPLKKENEGGGGDEYPPKKEENEDEEEDGGGSEEYPQMKDDEEEEGGGGEEYPPKKEDEEKRGDPENSGMDPENSGMDPENSGMDPKNSGMDPENSGMDPENSGMDPENSGIDPKNSGMDPKNSGMDPKNSGMDQLDIINLLEYLKKYRISVVELYTCDNRYTMAKCITHFGNISFISIPSRYQINYAKNIKVPTVKMKTITQFDINVADTFTTQPTININNDNIQELLKYRGCVVTDSNIKLKRSIVNITGQLARLKPCTEYLEYKLCIKFDEYFFVIDESNNLQSYSTSDYSSNRCLYPIVTLNSVMSKLKASDSMIDVLHSDISNIFDSLLSILNQTNREHLKKMEQEVKDQEIVRDIRLVYDKGYLQDLLSTKQFLSEIIKSEDLSKKNLNRVSGDSTRQLKISQLKKSTYTLLIDIYNRFWNQILLIDEICFCYIQSLYLIKEQHKELKNHIHR